jgi:hypothetical protein
MKNKKLWEELIAYFPWYDTGHIENDASNNSSIVVCIRYRDNVSIEPLPSNDRGIFIEPFPSNNKGSFTEPLPSNDKGRYTDTNTHTTQQRDLINLLYFFKIRKVG